MKKVLRVLCVESLHLSDKVDLGSRSVSLAKGTGLGCGVPGLPRAIEETEKPPVGRGPLHPVVPPRRAWLPAMKGAGSTDRDSDARKRDKQTKLRIEFEKEILGRFGKLCLGSINKCHVTCHEPTTRPSHVYIRYGKSGVREAERGEHRPPRQA